MKKYLTTVCAAIVAAVIIGCGTPTPDDTIPDPAPTTTATKAPTLFSPDGPCATSQVGKSYEQNGITYTCGGPKPYHWLSPAASAATTAPPTATTPPPGPDTQAKPVSVEQANAGRSAQSYLDSSYFSRKGLISQLKFEGYSTKAATAAVDSMHINWNGQAEGSAKNYLETQSFSKKGLIAQLEYEGFTHSQAVHGVSKTGL